MALKKITQFKGSNAEYWKILNLIYSSLTNSTQIVLGLYVNKDIRDLDINNFLERKSIDISGEVLREDAYTEIKKSNIVDDVETNWFADAEDI